MSEMLRNLEEKKEVIKSLIRRLHDGEDAEAIKKEFADVIKGLTPIDIGRIEQELVKEGMPLEEVHRMCDIHLQIFKESLESSSIKVEPWHPLYILMEEHKLLLNFIDTLINATDDATVGNIIEHLQESEKHYLREENVLFPYLERHGITEPPKIMWMDHDRIREIKKTLHAIHIKRTQMDTTEYFEAIKSTAIALLEIKSTHFYKENNVLFPMALQTLTKDEWLEIRKEFDDIGYCCFTPTPEDIPEGEEPKGEVGPGLSGEIVLSTGSFSTEELEAFLNALPVDITFVDKNDIVRYFNQSKDRIFIRSRAVLGRTVQMCHPQKSIDIVNRILDDFKSGIRDKAEFWIHFQGRFIFIRYFPVRDSRGEYLGTLEVTQDITDIKNLEGEKRLLDY